MRLNLAKIGLWLCLAILAICLAATTIYHPIQQDEGVFLTIAKGLKNGLLPYRDFFDHKPPGVYWLFSGINFVFGSNITWYKIILIVTNLASAVLAYLIADMVLSKNTLKCGLRGSGAQALTPKNTLKPSDFSHGLSDYRRRGLRSKGAQALACFADQNNRLIKWSPGFSLFAHIFFFWITLIFEGQYLIAEPFMAFFISLGLYYFLSFRPKRERSGGIPFPTRIILSGFAFGVALLFKQTAILSIIAFVIYLTWQRQWRQLIFFNIGVIIPIFIATLYLWHYNLLVDAYRQIILYNFQYYPAEDIYKVIGLLTPSFLYALPIWVLFIYGAIAIFKYRNAANHSWTRGFVIILLLATLPIFSFLLRHYPHYWLQVAPFVAILAANTLKRDLCDGLSSKFKTPKQAKAWSPGAGAQALACFLIISSTIFTVGFLRTNFPKYQAERRLVQFIKHQDKPIYAENQFTEMYFLTNNKPPNKYLYITEITDWSEQAEEKTIETLKNEDYLIIWPGDSNYPYAKKLQSYIFENYKPIFWLNDLGVVVYRPQMDD